MSTSVQRQSIVRFATLIATSVLFVAMATALVRPQSVSAATGLDTAQLDWKDARKSLENGPTLLVGALHQYPRIVYAKLIVVNETNVTRNVECFLEIASESVDRARVSLPAGSASSPMRATLALQVAADQVSYTRAPLLRCGAQGVGVTGVFAEWAKMTDVRMASVDIVKN